MEAIARQSEPIAIRWRRWTRACSDVFAKSQAATKSPMPGKRALHKTQFTCSLTAAEQRWLRLPPQVI